MGIKIDLDPDSDHHGGSESLEKNHDPFSYKAKVAENRQLQLVQRVRSYCSGNPCASKCPVMVQLILPARFKFTDLQMMEILGLDSQSATQLRLYNLIIRLVIYTAGQLKQNVCAASLLEFPLTDLHDICYRIADCFDSLFFIPVSRKSENYPFRSSFIWDDRFNGLWPIVYLLVREFNT